MMSPMSHLRLTIYAIESKDGVEDALFMPCLIFYYVTKCYVFSEATTTLLESLTMLCWFFSQYISHTLACLF